MQLPNISYYLSTGCSYLSSGYSRYSAFRQKETEIYTSIFNTALKYAGVKEPFFTPFRTNLLVTPISLAVGAIIGYLLFFKAPPPTPTHKLKPEKKVEPTKSAPPASEPKTENFPNGKGEEKKKKKVDFLDTNTEVIGLTRKWLDLNKAGKKDVELLRKIDRSLLESNPKATQFENTFPELLKLLEEYEKKIRGQEGTVIH